MNKKILKAFAKKNRERIHWVEREFKRQLEKRGVAYEYQKVIKKYIVDFYLPVRHLIVELDGASHIGKEKEDETRERDLRRYGYRIIRFPNKFFINSHKNCFDMIETFPITKIKPRVPRKKQVGHIFFAKCWHGRNKEFCTDCRYK